ncbi:MAG: hypothetical protein V3T19_06110, partial [Acidiferrobacterales bacterium]
LGLSKYLVHGQSNSNAGRLLDLRNAPPMRAYVENEHEDVLPHAAVLAPAPALVRIAAPD